jgi:hypothetical protein
MVVGCEMVEFPHSEAPLVEAWLKVDRRAATEMGILLIRLTSPKPERVGKADILSLQERSNHTSIDGRILSNLRKDWMPADFVEIRLLLKAASRYFINRLAIWFIVNYGLRHNFEAAKINKIHSRC